MACWEEPVLIPVVFAHNAHLPASPPAPEAHLPAVPPVPEAHLPAPAPMVPDPLVPVPEKVPDYWTTTPSLLVEEELQWDPWEISLIASWHPSPMPCPLPAVPLAPTC